MKLHLFLFQFTIAVFFIFIFPVYFAMSEISSAGSAVNENMTGMAQVEIFKFKFIPQEITVKKGTRIRWTNKEKRQYHSVWFELLGEPEPEYIFPDETFERSFNESGTFPYRCGPHPKMTGVVHVE